MPVTPRVSARSLKTHIATVELPACAAAVDIVSKPVFEARTNIVITDARIAGEAAAVGQGVAPNISIWTLQRRLGAAIVALASIEFNDVTVFPDAYTPYSIGADLGLGVAIPAGTLICIDVDNAGTAQTPICLVEVEYWINEDV